MFVKKMLATLCASLALGTAAHAAQSFFMVVPLSNAPATVVPGGGSGSEPPPVEPPPPSGLLYYIDQPVLFAPGAPSRNVWVATPDYPVGDYGLALKSFTMDSWAPDWSIAPWALSSFAAGTLPISNCMECSSKWVALTDSGTVTNDGSGFQFSVSPPAAGVAETYFVTKDVDGNREGALVATAMTIPATIYDYTKLAVLPTPTGASESDKACAKNYMVSRGVGYGVFRGDLVNFEIDSRSVTDAGLTMDKIVSVKFSQGGQADVVVGGSDVVDSEVGSFAGTYWWSVASANQLQVRIPAGLTDGDWVMDLQNDYGVWTKPYMDATGQAQDMVVAKVLPSWDVALSQYSSFTKAGLSAYCPESEAFCTQAERTWTGTTCADTAPEPSYTDKASCEAAGAMWIDGNCFNVVNP